ncbi:MAG: AgmX/PglI C-terminal domain-containing protein [Myxococcota bacterium]
MQCPRCQTELPAAAKFCGVCGHKFQVQVTGDAKSKVAREEPDASIRFFQDTTSQTDLDRNRALRDLAEKHMATTPSPQPAATASPSVDLGQAVAAPSEPGPAVASAAPAPSSPEPTVGTPPAVVPPAPVSAPTSPEPSVDPVTRQPFQFQPQELARALGRAASGEHKPPPNASPDDVGAFYKAGEAAGISRKTLEDALHQVAVERVKRQQAPAQRTRTIEAGIPEPGEFEPIQPSGKKVAMIAGGVVLAIVGAVFALSGGEEKPVTPAEVAQPKPAATPDAPAAAAPAAEGENKAKRKPGTLDTKLIGPAIAAVGEKSRTCHEAARKQNPKLEGKLVLDVELEEDGTFSKLAVKEDGLKDAAMVECVKQQVRAHAWPKPTGGFFAMEFPLLFQLAEEPKAATGKKGKGRKR